MTKVPVFIYYRPCSQQIGVLKFKSLVSFLYPGDQLTREVLRYPHMVQGSAPHGRPQQCPLSSGLLQHGHQGLGPVTNQEKNISKCLCLYKHHKQLF